VLTWLDKLHVFMLVLLKKGLYYKNINNLRVPFNHVKHTSFGSHSTNLLEQYTNIFKAAFKITTSLFCFPILDFLIKNEAKSVRSVLLLVVGHLPLLMGQNWG